MKKILISLLLLFSLFTHYLVSFCNFDLNNLQNIFSIISSFSIGVALFTYIEKKNQDKLLSTIEQITFFRKEIISANNELIKEIKKEFPEHIISTISLENLSIDYIRDKYSSNFKHQEKIIIDTVKDYPNIGIKELHTKQVFLLNMIEEFSLRVLHLDTVENPAIQSVHFAFIEIVENNALAILFTRLRTGDESIYSSILKIYNSWKPKTLKAPFLIKVLEDNKFITKKQKEDFYEMRRGKFGF